MKKTLLLLTLPLAFLMAIDFTMTRDGLFVNEELTPTPIPQETTNPTNEQLHTDMDITNIKITEITENSANITWEGNPDAQTWVYVYEPYNSTGKKHTAKNNQFLYATLAPDTHFTVYVQGINSSIVLSKDFITKKNTVTENVSSPISPLPTTFSETAVDLDSSNPYLEKINLPSCDSNNPEVQFIKTNADWSHINDIDKRVFCVFPGDYKSLKKIKLETSGTLTKRRFILLYNKNNLHPAKLEKEQLAQYSLEFNHANYWTIDRGYWSGNSLGIIYHFINGSSYNIINRSYVKQNLCTVEIRESCHNNTIQNTRIDSMTENARKADQVSIRLVSSKTNFEIKNTKIVNNEIKNSNDSFQTVLSRVTGENKQNGNCEGTIINNNNFYITSKLYTDGKGNYDPNGAYAYAENAIDLKFGSKNSKKPILITNNHLWGYRKSDKTNSYTGDPGYAIVAHYNVGNLIFHNNLIFDSNAGFGASDKKDFPNALFDTQITNNIFYNCGQIYGSNQKTYPILIGSSNNIKVTYNTIINSRNNAMFFGFNGSQMSVMDNYAINSNSEILLQDNILGIYNKMIEKTISNLKEYPLIIEKFTNNEKVVVINMNTN